MKKVDTIVPKVTGGLHHVALYIRNFDACINFYTHLLGMEIEWQPDPDNVYLTSGNDNLALHRAPPDFRPSKFQHLDHIGFIIPEIEQVDIWYDYLRDHQIKMKSVPKTHRDGARSFYCCDPDGNTIQIIYHPPISSQTLIASIQDKNFEGTKES